MKQLIMWANIVIFTILLIGCTTGKSKWSSRISAGYVDYTVANLEPHKYKLVAKAASIVKRNALEQAYKVRAKQLCKANPYQTKYDIKPYQYSTNRGTHIYQHDAFIAIGIVTC